MPEEPLGPSIRRFGNYDLLAMIARGGMSSVYKARDIRTQAIVAVKVASRQVIFDRRLSRRFELEYGLAHPLAHANLVKVLDYGKHEKTPYLVMEYIDGPSVAQKLRADSRLGEADALAIVLPVIDALAYLHKKQIIHRDIKPGNILLTASGTPKLADLGLVKNLDSMSRLTRTNLGLGTMQFASPEQFEDARSVDARSDIYSLAVTLYVMLTGDYPFGQGPLAKILARKLENRFEPPIAKAPKIRVAVNVAICQALHADREKRPASVGDFAAMLSGEKQILLPAPPPVLAAKSKVIKKDARERRGGARYAIEMEAVCRAVVNVGGKRWPAWAIDISTTGLCLRSQRRFEPASVLEIAFTLQTDGSVVSQLVRVRWAKATVDKSWMLGCEFVNALEGDELNAICADRMDRTKMT